MSWSDWDLIKGRLGKCKVRVDIWGYFASAFFSVVLALGIIIFISSDSLMIGLQNTLTVIFWVCVTGLILSLIARVHLGYIQHRSVDNVLEDMNHLEEKYNRPPS